jgi:hypothetical protein
MMLLLASLSIGISIQKQTVATYGGSTIWEIQTVALPNYLIPSGKTT